MHHICPRSIISTILSASYCPGNIICTTMLSGEHHMHHIIQKTWTSSAPHYPGHIFWTKLSRNLNCTTLSWEHYLHIIRGILSAPYCLWNIICTKLSRDYICTTFSGCHICNLFSGISSPRILYTKLHLKKSNPKFHGNHSG